MSCNEGVFESHTAHHMVGVHKGISSVADLILEGETLSTIS